MNNKDRAVAKERYDRVLAVVGVEFNNIFNRKNPKALKHKISQDLVEATDFTKAEIQSFLAIWCGTLNYQASLMRGTFRYNLSGKSTGVITWDERQFACSRYHNYQARKFGIKTEIELSPVFNKANMAGIMYDNWCAHKELASVSKVTELFDVNEINFIVGHYRGDRDEESFKDVTEAYLLINKDTETLIREEFEI